MTGFLFLTVIIVSGVIFFFVRVARSRKDNEPRQMLDMSEVGAIIDRSIWSYRQHLVPFLILSLLCLPLGISSTQNIITLLLTISAPGFFFHGSSITDVIATLLIMLRIISVFAIGKTLLSCGVARALHIASTTTGKPVRLVDALPYRPAASVAAMVGLIAGLSLLVAFLDILGLLVALLWALAPAVMYSESIGAFRALQQGVELTMKYFSGLLRTLLLLWFIGWLVVGTPIFVSVWLLQFAFPLSSDVMSSLIFLGWIIGQVFVAPLVAIGSVHFYLFVRDRPELKRRAKHAWNERTIRMMSSLSPVYAWMGSKVAVSMDKEELVQIGGTRTRQSATTRFMYDEQPHTLQINIETALFRARSADYVLRIDNEIIGSGKIFYQNWVSALLRVFIVILGATLFVVGILFFLIHI